MCLYSKQFEACCGAIHILSGLLQVSTGSLPAPEHWALWLLSQWHRASQRWAMGCSWASHKGEGGEYEWCVIPASVLRSLAECLKVWWRQTWRTTLVKSHPTSMASPFHWQIWVNKLSFNQMFLYAEIYHEVNYFIQWKPSRNQTMEIRWLEEKLEDIETFQPWVGSLPPLGAALELWFLNWYRFISIKYAVFFTHS